MTQIPAGWYPDPAPQTLPGRLRYWDGAAWTEHLHDPQPAAPPAYPAPPGQAQADAPAQSYPQNYPQGPDAPMYAQAAATTPDGVPLAGWWWRVLARVLDSFIALPLYALAAAPVVISQWDELEQWFDDLTYAADHNTPDPPAPDLFDFTSGPGLTLLLSGLAAYLLYEIVFLLWKQATPGKLVVGLRVRRRDNPDLPASAVFGRVGFVLLGQFCGLLLVLDYLWPLWDDKKQALHDKVVGTNVVRPRQGNQEIQGTGIQGRGIQWSGTEPPNEAGLPPRW